MGRVSAAAQLPLVLLDLGVSISRPYGPPDPPPMQPMSFAWDSCMLPSKEPLPLAKTPSQSRSSHTSFHQGMMQPPGADETWVPSLRAGGWVYQLLLSVPRASLLHKTGKSASCIETGHRSGGETDPLCWPCCRASPDQPALTLE